MTRNSTLILTVTPEELTEAVRKVLREEISQIQQKHKDPVYLTRNEVSKLLKISLPTLNEYTRKGIIKGSRIGTRILYREKDILDSIKSIPKRNYK